MSPTDRLLSIEAIKKLKTRYFRFVDAKDWAGSHAGRNTRSTYRLVLRCWEHYHETYERGASRWVIKTAHIVRLRRQFGPTETGPERYAKQPGYA